VAPGGTVEARVSLNNVGVGASLYSDNPFLSSFGPSTFVFANVGSIGSMTGSLGIGSYEFSFLSMVYNAQGGSSVSDFITLTLTRPDGGGNGVPDAGSTVTLLGMALLGLGGVARRFGVAV
jgi:VPDSG-CTERM motif